jgi:ABC-type transport system involved in multi-copper enzyme maturation permease subunit
MAINYSRVLTLIEKDWAELRKSKYVLYSLIGLPLILAILMPLSTVGAFVLIPEDEQGDSLPYINSLQPPIPMWDTLTEFQRTIVVMTYFSHIFFLIIPAMIPSVIAADSIAGEKSRKSFEAILATPLSNSEILIGKIGLPFILGVVGTLIGAIPYCIILYYLTSLATIPPLLPFNILLDINFILLVVLLTPASGLLTAVCMVFVSSRVSNTRDAQQLGAFIVLPLIIYFVAQVILIIFSTLTIIVGAVILFLIDIVLIKFSINVFSRENIMTKFT